MNGGETGNSVLTGARTLMNHGISPPLPAQYADSVDLKGGLLNNRVLQRTSPGVQKSTLIFNTLFSIAPIGLRTRAY